jgi:hypothetical protein
MAQADLSDLGRIIESLEARGRGAPAPAQPAGPPRTIRSRWMGGGMSIGNS